MRLKVYMNAVGKSDRHQYYFFIFKHYEIQKVGEIS